MTIFKKLIKEEKELHKELLELDKNQRHKEMLKKRYLVFRANKRRSMAKVSREFALQFAQHKNVISKHASIGEKRRRENEYLESCLHKKSKSKTKSFRHVPDDSTTSQHSFIKSNRYHSKPNVKQNNF